MGTEAQTSVKFGRKSYATKALLESNEIILRGEIRLKIPFSEMTLVEARDGRLHLEYQGGTAILDLGDQAARWADKIKNPKSRIDKLGIKPEHRVALISVKDPTFVAELRARVHSISNGKPVKDADAIFLGASSLEGLERLPELVAYIKRNGAIWTVTPKGKGGIKDTDVMAAGKAAGLVDVKVVSFSDTHSANKFVIPKAKR
jgi:hypothetical protein